MHRGLLSNLDKALNDYSDAELDQFEEDEIVGIKKPNCFFGSSTL